MSYSSVTVPLDGTLESTENVQTNGVIEDASELDEEASGLISEIVDEAAAKNNNDGVPADEEESDDEDVNVIVRTGANAVNQGVIGMPPSRGTTSYQAKSASAQVAQAASKQTKSIDLSAPGNIGSVPTTDFNLTSLPDTEKPWKQPGADITDYFNYGFTEETWVQYAERQRSLRNQYGGNLPSTGPVNQIRAVGQYQQPIYRPPRESYQSINRVHLHPDQPTGAISVIGSTPSDSRRPMETDLLAAAAAGLQNVGSLGMPPTGAPPPFPPGMSPFGPGVPGAPFSLNPPPGFPPNPFLFPPPGSGLIPGTAFPPPWPGVFPPMGIERAASPSSMKSDDGFQEMVAAPPMDVMEHVGRDIGYSDLNMHHSNHHRDRDRGESRRRPRDISPRDFGGDSRAPRDMDRSSSRRHRNVRSRSRSPSRRRHHGERSSVRRERSPSGRHHRGRSPNSNSTTERSERSSRSSRRQQHRSRSPEPPSSRGGGGGGLASSEIGSDSAFNSSSAAGIA